MLVSVAQTQLFFLALTRVLAILIHIPVLGGNSIPLQVRLAFGIVLALILVPWQQPLSAEVESMALLAFAMAIFREIIIGTLAGYAANLTFGAIQMAGELTSMATGFSSGRVLNPLIGEGGSSLDQLFTMTALLVFLVINGHHLFIMAIQQIFVLLPVNSPLPSFSAETLLTLTSQLIVIGIQLALPIYGAMLLTDITLGLLARVAPQVQVFFLGLPAKIGLGMMGFSLTLAIILPKLTDYMRSIGPWMLKLLGS